MPFKEDVIALVDEVEPSARASTRSTPSSTTTAYLTASNTDYLAVQRLIDEHRLDPAGPVLIRGSGGMASAVGAAFRDTGSARASSSPATRDAGRALADRLGYDYAAEVGDRTRGGRSSTSPRSGWRAAPEASERAFDEATIATAHTVFDVVALPSETPLITAARARGRRTSSPAPR